MTFTLEPATAFAQPLNYLIMKATFDPANKIVDSIVSNANEWFFYDGSNG
jgi:hypothetical protein